MIKYLNHCSSNYFIHNTIVCNFYHVMANKALTHDTITIQAPTPSQLNDDNTDKSCIKPVYKSMV